MVWIVVAAFSLISVVACNDDDGHHEDGGREDGGGDAALSDVEALCSCLLTHCHDPFHAQYGEDDGVAIAGCEAEAGALPRAEMPVMSGNFLECRAGFCEGAMMDDTMCAAALGGAPCQ